MEYEKEVQKDTRLSEAKK